LPRRIIAPGRTEVGAGWDRHFVRIAVFGSLLPQQADVRHGRSGVGWKRNRSPSGAQSREKPTR
jgi:hypothetical protein